MGVRDDDLHVQDLTEPAARKGVKRSVKRSVKNGVKRSVEGRRKPPCLCPNVRPKSKTAVGKRLQRFMQLDENGCDPQSISLRRLDRGSHGLLLERATGLEPATSSLGSWHSTN
jgi:hypothetical protein